MSTDPVTHEWESPYAAMGNNPIVLIDPLGASSTRPEWSEESETDEQGQEWITRTYENGRVERMRVITVSDRRMTHEQMVAYNDAREKAASEKAKAESTQRYYANQAKLGESYSQWYQKEVIRVKLIEYRKALQKLWNNRANLSTGDTQITKQLLGDIQNALSGH